MTDQAYNFAYLDEQTKRMIRRAILKITDTLSCTTWRLVTTVRGAAKNPLPRASPASIDTIAGIARLTTSSKELGA